MEGGVRMYKKIRLWLCKYLDWHSPEDYHCSEKDPNGFLVYARCKWCGKKGMIDSQGGLF